MPSNRSCLHLRNVRLTVVRVFKGYCARRGYTMSAAIEHLMKVTAERGAEIPQLYNPRKDEDKPLCCKHCGQRLPEVPR